MEDGKPLKRKRKGKFTVNLSAPNVGEAGNSNDATVGIPILHDAAMDRQIWKYLPGELLDIIIVRLPFAARCRFQCVCMKWKKILQDHTLISPPACMIMSFPGSRNAKFFCDSEKKWFSLPSNQYLPSDEVWEVVDAEGGLVCYQCNRRGRIWFWVFNPLKPSSSRLLAPTYLDGQNRQHAQAPPVPSHPCRVKLLVDRVSKTFKVIAFSVYPWTAVYESTTSSWCTHTGLPWPWYDLETLRYFVWENRLHAYSTLKQNPARGDNYVSRYNVERNSWHLMKEESLPPSGPGSGLKRFFLSYNNEVVLVLHSHRLRPLPYFCVWKLQLLDEDSSLERNNLLVKRERWKKTTVGSRDMAINLANHRMACARFGGDHIWFVFKDELIKEDDSSAYKCVQYAFESEIWSVIPCPKGFGKPLEVFNWKPCPDERPHI